MLILTFTQAAANEMKERIRKNIKKNNLTEQLNKLDNSYITTFDSFFLSLVKKKRIRKNLYLLLTYTERKKYEHFFHRFCSSCGCHRRCRSILLGSQGQQGLQEGISRGEK